MLTQEYLQLRFIYFPDSGIFVWRGNETRSNQWNSRCANKNAGSIDGQGYIQITIDGTSYLAHRLAFLYMTGEWPIRLIDHKDTNCSNNAWSNIRQANHSQNGFNSRVSSRNTSGYKGVTPFKGKFTARVGINGKQQYLGIFDTAELANIAVLNKRQELHGEFSRDS